MKINTKTINDSLSIVDYMVSLGYEKARNSTINYTFFLSPFNFEKTASFYVDISKNRFMDFSSGYKGDIIELIIKLKNCTFKEAVDEIKSIAGNYTPSPKIKKESLVTDKVTEITDGKLVDYLTNKRGIPIIIARYYCKEIHYHIGKKHYKAIGFKNDKNGWELRNPYWKGGTNPKTITTIEGKGKMINVFEGFIDFLSCLAEHKTLKLYNTTIILNSAVFASLLPQNRAYNVFTDNDEAGNEVLEILSEIGTVMDYRESFQPFNDYNDYWIDKLKIK